MLIKDIRELVVTDDLRDKIDDLCVDLSQVNSKLVQLVTLINLSNQEVMEVCLGCVSRNLLGVCEPLDSYSMPLWLIIGSALARSSIGVNSPSRMTIPGVGTHVDWSLPEFSYLVSSMDGLIIETLYHSNDLIREQVVDFLGCANHSYSFPFRTPGSISKYKQVLNPLIKSMGEWNLEWDLREEWEEGLNTFLNYLNTNVKVISDYKIKGVLNEILLISEGDRVVEEVIKNLNRVFIQR